MRKSLTCICSAKRLRRLPGILFFIALTFPAFSQTMSLDEALASLGSIGEGAAQFRWDPFFSSGTFTVGRHEATFASGRAGETGAVILDRRDVLTLLLPYSDRGSIWFPEPFVTQVRNTFARYAEEARSRFRVAAIVIDPGHGGRDPGAIGTHTVQGRVLRSVEKDIVLNVSRQLYALLSASFPDKQVLLTRNDDTHVTLENRVDMAHSIPMAENEAAIFVSVHANASFNRNARGFEIFYLRPGYRREVIDLDRHSDNSEVLWILNSMMEQTLATESILLANNILRRFDEAIGDIKPNRGIKPAEWFVVRNARMPSVLVELGFVTNETDALLMDNAAHLNKISQALYKGVSDFVAFFERTGGVAAAQ
ncbi:MAG: N-acetylmuramoyl-L-alanine amidase [Treponema sp.]|nr:N-acetylmuramoyl-L-alanine amidase [Treponema sp.]